MARDQNMSGSTGGSTGTDGGGATVTGATSSQGTSQSAFKKYGVGGLKLAGIVVLATVISIGVDAAREAMFHGKAKAKAEEEQKWAERQAAQDRANAEARKDLASQIGKVVVEGVGSGIAGEVVKGLRPDMDVIRDKLVDVNESIMGLRSGFAEAMDKSTDRIVVAIERLREPETAGSGRGSSGNRSGG